MCTCLAAYFFIELRGNEENGGFNPFRKLNVYACLVFFSPQSTSIIIRVIRVADYKIAMILNRHTLGCLRSCDISDGGQTFFFWSQTIRAAKCMKWILDSCREFSLWKQPRECVRWANWVRKKNRFSSELADLLEIGQFTNHFRGSSSSSNGLLEGIYVRIELERSRTPDIYIYIYAYISSH